MKYIVHNNFVPEEFSELDFELYSKLGLEDDDEHENIINNFEYDYVEGDPIEIDKLMHELVKLKSRGANYVRIDNDLDHYGYIIQGVEIHLASKKEIQTFFHEKEKEKQAKKNERIHKLRKELDNLENKK